MSSVVLDAGAAVSQVPAVYAETLFCGGGGVIAGTDPAVGIRFSRLYGGVGNQSELLAGVYKDISGPAAGAGEVGGTLSVAGLRFGNIASIANGVNAGSKVCGTCQLVGGTLVVNATGTNNLSPTNRSIIFLQRYDLGGSTALGTLMIGAQTNSSFTINSLDATTPANLVAGDSSFIYWMMINPDFGS